MKVQGLDWIGTRTSRFRETVTFFEQNLGLSIGVERDDFVRLDLPDSSVVEVFGPEDRDHVYFTTGPAVGFRVDDLPSAREELRAHAIELLGSPGGEEGGVQWQHFRAPDGYVYEVVENPDRVPRGPPLGRVGISHLAWVGTRTPHYEATQIFFARVLGLELFEELDGLAEYRLPDGASVEVFRPGTPLDHPHFSTGPVPGFGVVDLDAARDVLESQGIRLLQSKATEQGGWAHFQAPDGYVYEVKGPRGAGGPRLT